MIAERNPIIGKAYAELQRLSYDEETQLLYEAREKAIRDENSRIRSALNKGIKEGMSQGMAEGMSKSRAEIAKNLLKMGLSVKQISDSTGLSIEEIIGVNEN